MAGRRASEARRKKPVSLWIITLEGVLLGLAGVAGILSVEWLMSPGLAPASDSSVLVDVNACTTLASVSGCEPSPSR